MSISRQKRVESPCPERRKEFRYTLILRVGVLEQAGKASLCLVKNISSSGLQLKCYARPTAEAEASIRVADEAPLFGRILWLSDDVAGMTFDNELDTATLLRVQQKLRPNRRRSTPRVNIEANACVRSGGRIQAAVIHDISCMGARITTTSPLNVGDRAIVTLRDLPALPSYVRWSEGEEAGLVFEAPIPMQIIAHWVDGNVCLTS